MRGFSFVFPKKKKIQMIKKVFDSHLRKKLIGNKYFEA